MDNEQDGNARCDGCDAPFRCGMRDGEARCWCADLPNVVPVPGDGPAACLCPDCLDELIRKRHGTVTSKASAASADYRAAGGPDGK